MAKTMEQMLIESQERAITQDFVVSEIDEDTYSVFNCMYNTEYEVKCRGDLVVSCTCGHYVYRGVICKHIIRTAMETGKSVDYM
jgi:hypothetical protein